MNFGKHVKRKALYCCSVSVVGLLIACLIGFAMGVGLVDVHLEEEAHAAASSGTSSETSSTSGALFSFYRCCTNIEGSGSDMKVPNVYVAEGGTSTVNLAYYFVNGEKLTYTCTSDDAAVATVTVSNNLMEVTGVKTGATHITVKVSDGSEQTITVTVRQNAGGNGWM